MQHFYELNCSPDKGRSGEIRALTVLRGIAAWWVVVYHFKLYVVQFIPWIASIANIGYLAVDLFFWLSGFVLFINYGHIIFKSRDDFVSFYVKRIARIYPLHFVILMAYLILFFGVISIKGSIGEPDRYSPLSFILNIFLVHNWSLPERLTWNIPSWSISVELFAYILFPLLLGIRSLNVPMIVLSIFLLLGSVGLSFSVLTDDIGDDIGRYGLLRCVAQFTGGMLLALLWIKNSRLSNGTCLFMLLIAIFGFIGSGYFGIERAVYVPACWAITIYALADITFSPKWSRVSIFVYLGEISYSTYMVHYLFYDIYKYLFVSADHTTSVLALTACFALVLIASSFLYHFVERPGQRLLLRMQRKRPA